METYSDEPDGTLGSLRSRVAQRSTSEPPPVLVGFGSTTSTQKTRMAIPLAPGGTKFRRVMAWLGLSLPIWVGAMAVASPVSVSCTSVSVPEGYDRGFGQIAVVCWATLRVPAQQTNEPSPGSTNKSDPPSLGSWPTGTVTPYGASWVWTKVQPR